VQELTSQNEHVYTVGSLSLDGMQNFSPIDKKTFYARFEIPDKDFILITFHPETVALDSNIHFANEMKTVLAQLQQTNTLIITMPNADTLGSEYRKQLQQLKHKFPETVLLIENFGKANYFSAMYYARLLLGNTSSGIIEAASFKKYVINVGDRQKGRAQSNNTLNATFDSDDILAKTKEALALGEYNDSNIYFKENTADEIIKIIKEHAKF
jgi:GDP/UDP-N,N'-diacetylbacillosamine 2-epimerase (hydrolysing)